MNDVLTWLSEIGAWAVYILMSLGFTAAMLFIFIVGPIILLLQWGKANDPADRDD